MTYAARRTPVVPEPLMAGQPADYADAFVVDVEHPDGRPAEEWVRAGLEGAPTWLRRVILLAHRRVLLFRLGPVTAADHVLGWRVVHSEHDVVHLSAEGPLLRGAIIARRTGPCTARLSTFVAYRQPHLARVAWAVAGPVHRRVAPYLLQRAATLVAAPPV